VRVFSRRRVSMCLTVRVSVTRPYYIKTAKRMITQTTPHDSPGSLVFLTPTVVGERPSFPLKFALKLTNPLSNTTKEVQLVLIESRPRAFQRAIDEPGTLPLSPQRVAQNAILLFLVSKIQLLSKKSATTFLRVKTSSGKVVATPFRYLLIIIIIFIIRSRQSKK